MAESPRATRRGVTESLRWEQTTLALKALEPGSAIAAARSDEPAQGMREALRAVDHAADGGAQRDLLARVYAQLAAHALARGRTPVPKAAAVGRRPQAD